MSNADEQIISGSVRGRLVRGFGAAAVGPIVTIAVQIVTVPLFLHYWGTSLYGEWLILSAIPMYIALSDIGFGSVAGNDMTMRVAGGDRDGALTTFQSTWVLVSAISVAVAGAAAAVLLSPIQIRTLLHLGILTERDARLVLILLMGQVLLTLQCNLAASAFRSDGLYAVGTFWWNFTRLCEYLIATGAVCFGATPVGVAAAFLMTRIAGTLWLYGLLFSRIHWISVGIRSASLTRIRELSVPAAAFMAFPTGNAISLQGMVIVIGHLLGPVSVVIFSTLRTLTRFAIQLMGLINNTVWPELSIAYGAGLRVRARNLHRRACQFSLWIAILAVAGLALAGPRIYALWTHGSVPMNGQLFNLLLLVVVANSFWYTSSVATVACNAHQKIAGWYIAGALASIVLAYFLTPRLGLDAAALALLAIDVCMIGVVVHSSTHLLEDDFREFVRAILAVPPLISMARTLLREP